MEESKDKWLVCNECGRQFLWDAGEQAWYRLKNFLHQPKRCKQCRDQKRGSARFGETPGVAPQSVLK